MENAPWKIQPPPWKIHHLLQEIIPKNFLPTENSPRQSPLTAENFPASNIPMFLNNKYYLQVMDKLLQLLLLTTDSAPSRLRPTQLRTLLLLPNLFKTSLFTPSKEVPISFKSLFMTSSNPRQGQPAFRLDLRGWPKGQSSAICHPFSAKRALAIPAFLLLQPRKRD